ncbi:MAG: ABC transporter permease [Dehalococcoidia bacterium]
MVGCIYALVALGFVVVVNVTRVYNFAQGEYVMLGGMIAAWGSRSDWPLLATVPFAVIVVGLVGLAQERLTVAPIRNANPLTLVVVTLGVGIVIRGAALILFGKDLFRAPAFTEGVFEINGARFVEQTAWVWAVTALLLVAALLFFRFTMLGRAMRACAVNPRAARLMGIRLERLSMAAFVLSAALGGLVGTVIAPITFTSWEGGIAIGVKGFIAAALGAFTNPAAAVGGGLGLGVAESLGAGYVSSAYRDAFVFGILIVYLVGREFSTDQSLHPRRLWQQLRHGLARLQSSGGEALAGVLERAGAPAAEGATLRRRAPAMIAVAAFLLLSILIPQLTSDVRDLDTMISILLLGIGATGLGLVMGYAGQFVLGQAAFYLIGGYTTGVLTVDYGWGALPALLVAALLSASLAFAIGWPTMRLKGFNLAIATLAMHFILLVVVRQEMDLTGGVLGKTGIQPFSAFGWEARSQKEFYYVAWAVLVLSLLVAYNISRSRMGRALRALGNSPEAAESLGIDATKYKVQIFVISSVMASVAGSLWAHYLRFAGPGTWDFSLTIDLITYVVVGGMTSVWGGLIGTIFVRVLQEWVRDSGFGDTLSGNQSTYEVIISGVLIVVFLVAFPRGLASLLRQSCARISLLLAAARPFALSIGHRARAAFANGKLRR